MPRVKPSKTDDPANKDGDADPHSQHNTGTPENPSAEAENNPTPSAENNPITEATETEIDSKDMSDEPVGYAETEVTVADEEKQEEDDKNAASEPDESSEEKV